jgi:hypothetical protein
VSQGRVEGVEHAQKLLDNALGRPLQVLGLLAEDTLAVVVEVGLDAQQLLEIVVALGCELGHVGENDLLGVENRLVLSREVGMVVARLELVLSLAAP